MQEAAIPQFRDDGYLPTGVHIATESETLFGFGASTLGRRKLVLRLHRWIDLARAVAARRLLVDGSFVTAKAEPGDVDAVVFLPEDFEAQISAGKVAALELEEMLRSRRPEELFAAEDQRDWDEWIEFFGRTREDDGRRKGLVEITL